MVLTSSPSFHRKEFKSNRLHCDGEMKLHPWHLTVSGWSTVVNVVLLSLGHLEIDSSPKTSLSSFLCSVPPHPFQWAQLPPPTPFSFAEFCPLFKLKRIQDQSSFFLNYKVSSEFSSMRLYLLQWTRIVQWCRFKKCWKEFRGSQGGGWPYGGGECGFTHHHVC